MTIAAEGLRRIAECYRIEGEIRGMDPGQRLSARQTRTAPLVTGFGQWLQLQRRRISSKSRPGEKLACIHRQWNGLQTSLRDGRVGTGSNAPSRQVASQSPAGQWCENLIRPIANGWSLYTSSLSVWKHWKLICRIAPTRALFPLYRGLDWLRV
ncbi:transposase [Leisingera sp. F5]|uniref:IS66 family transposase n=1 Tax=Leisingera sp. F5 TaxID=1813816 RepID=UPI000AB6A419|nr:transposase [Leisingera sp. F5]